ncbi:MAG TPA: sulfite exporter TauE/SafE family protein [Candidatus Paceibacterota bacterium]|nr:sulfite exporter TauE/SafE family protein [Verrucomicrobiota bacterium]HRY50971.1 sulfite exporter TauE/SafE family protein [Candidatus Paceibacterota bacterium]
MHWTKDYLVFDSGCSNILSPRSHDGNRRFPEENGCGFGPPAAYMPHSDMHYLMAGLIGLASGVASGLFGVGGGIIMVPAMMMLMGVPIKTAVGTSLAVIIPTAVIGVSKHFHQQNVSLPLALSLAPTALIGGYMGAWLTTLIDAPQLKRAFGAFLVLVGLRLLCFKG